MRGIKEIPVRIQKTAEKQPLAVFGLDSLFVYLTPDHFYMLLDMVIQVSRHHLIPESILQQIEIPIMLPASSFLTKIRAHDLLVSKHELDLSQM